MKQNTLDEVISFQMSWSVEIIVHSSDMLLLSDIFPNEILNCSLLHILNIMLRTDMSFCEVFLFHINNCLKYIKYE